MSEENDSGVDAGSDSNLSVSMSVGSSQGSDDEPVCINYYVVVSMLSILIFLFFRSKTIPISEIIKASMI